jgi:hypothetical protein
MVSHWEIRFTIRRPFKSSPIAIVFTSSIFLANAVGSAVTKLHSLGPGADYRSESLLMRSPNERIMVYDPSQLPKLEAGRSVLGAPSAANLPDLS